MPSATAAFHRRPLPRSRNEPEFACVECLGIAGWCSRLHSAQPQQGKERLGNEPRPVPLAAKVNHERGHLGLSLFATKGNEQTRVPQVRVVFWDFILQNEVVPEGVPGQFGYHTMVLMVVPPVMRENNIRFKALHALNRGFDLSKLRRKEAIPEGVNNDL